MTPMMEWFVARSCALAGLAYAARMKRLGHGYYAAAVIGLFERSDGSEVVYSGSMPRWVTVATDPPVTARVDFPTQVA
jgi:hypothetical protein